MKYYIIRKCVICEREFYVKDEKKEGIPSVAIIKGSLVRREDCLTCSRECSRKYTNLKRNRSPILIKYKNDNSL